MDSSSSPTSPNHHLSTVNVSNFVSSKLHGDEHSNNYFSWREQMLNLMESHDLLRFIDGTIRAPEPLQKGWRNDRIVRGWIICLLDDSVPRPADNSTSARDVWLGLENFFSKSNIFLTPHNTNDVREWRDYLSLYRATLSGDWVKAKRIIDRDPNALKARVAFTQETCLHIAAGTGKAIHFVQNLVDIMPDELIGVKDGLGHSALHVAARTGNTEAAEIVIRRRPDLLCVPNNVGNFPVHLAAHCAHRETLRYLINMTNADCIPSPYLDQTGLELLCSVIDANIFDVALYLAEKYSDLATLKLRNGDSALLRIASKDWAFSGAVPSTNKTNRTKQIRAQALQLVKCLLKNMESMDSQTASQIYNDVMITAARLGVHEVIEEIVETFPSAIYSHTPNHQYIFHVAVENRSEKVFNLIYQTSNLKHQFFDILDTSGNTLLHLAGQLAPTHHLNLISGAALQMQRELQWNQEVEKFLHPHSRERPNKAGKTPQMVFTEEHKELKANGEKWMKETATSCTIVAALIATVAFAAAITVPGGNRSDTGFPLLYTHSAFILFAISDAISLFTSITSLLMFLSILTSRYAEHDFLYALPKRLCIGLVTLFMSISFMIVAFSAILYLVFGKAEKNWILIPVTVLACLPVTTFALLQFPLLVDVISNTYGRGIFGKQSNRRFY